MKQIEIIVICIILFTVKLTGQNDLNFEYKNSGDRNCFSQINLEFPSGELYQLFADTLSILNISHQNYFTEKGKYNLIVNINKTNFEKDSINCIFNLNGEETSIDINVSYSIREQYFTSKKNIKKIDNNRIEGYISITKYYNSIDSVSIGLIKSYEPNEYYKGPFFWINNRSRDTIYGEYIPNFLWGSLYVLHNDSVWIGKVSQIDTNFEGSTPLYPDSVTVATVGSFGYSNKLANNKYKYILLYSTDKDVTRGLRKYKENDSFVWWMGVKDYYRLIYEFEIKD